MSTIASTLVRYGAYPLVMGGAATAILAVTRRDVTPWFALATIALTGTALVAWLERIRPYQRAWLQDHADTLTDAIHVLVNLGLLSMTAYAVHALRAVWSPNAVWPLHWPLWAQVLLVGAVIDLGLYAMHRWSHRSARLWRLHAIHHSAERLYWMNGERRHPLSAVVMAGPGIVAVVVLGASSLVVSAWLALLSVHLAFQHANLDYTVGPLRHVLGVAEIHRWHHKREYEHAQVNFGEFWMVWDHLFGTFHDRPNGVLAGEVGLRERDVPPGYVAQIRWPFQGINAPRTDRVATTIQPTEQ